MSWYDVIAEHLKINEPFELPDKLMACMMTDEREELFRKCLMADSDLSRDTLSIPFQDALGNRDKLMQDFTPDGICRIIAELTGQADTIADVCAGTGGLTIRTLNKNPNATYHLEEKSKAAIPVLLFNLAIRNVKATVTQGDVLTRSVDTIYNLDPSEQFSAIVQRENEPQTVDKVITNPPYSLTWSPKMDERFLNYDLAPKSKADYAFILHGLSKLKDDGELFAILPHGVLFRGGAEEKIRRKLIENNLIDMVIGLPPNMFLDTQIPTVILRLKKNRAYSDTLFIDASRDFEKKSKYNELTDEHIEKILAVAKNRLTTERYSQVVTLKEIQDNDYNLNIPRYVDTSEPEEVIDLVEALNDYDAITKEIHETEKEFLELFMQIVHTDKDDEAGTQELKEAQEILRKKVETYEQLEFEW